LHRFTNATISNPNDERLIPQGGGTYSASGHILYLNEGKSWLYLNPYYPNGVQELTSKEISVAQETAPVLTINPASDTLTVQFNDFALKTAVIFWHIQHSNPPAPYRGNSHQRAERRLNDKRYGSVATTPSGF
jgi:hypothetical protein